MYIHGECAMYISVLLEETSKKQLSTPLTLGLLGLACFPVDGQYKPAMAPSVQNKCRMNSSKFIKSILNFAREWWKCVLSAHHMCTFYDGGVWPHTYIISIERQGGPNLLIHTVLWPRHPCQHSNS